VNTEAKADWFVTATLTQAEAEDLVKQLDSGSYQGGTVGALRNYVVMALRSMQASPVLTCTNADHEEQHSEVSR
jgi:hypothetical protein